MDLNMGQPSEQENEREVNGPKVGALLKASRQRLGEELADVALMLRIRLPYLIAIEAGRYQELPGATYAVGFIRAYAEHLGLDSEEVVRRFKAEDADSGGGDRKLSFPTPEPETGIPGGAYVFIGLVIAILGYGTWYLSTTQDELFTELVNPLDEQLTTMLSDNVPITPEKPETLGGLGDTQTDLIISSEETTMVLSEEKLTEPDKSETESVSGAAQTGTLVVKVEAETVIDTNIPDEIAPEISAEIIASVVVDPSEVNAKPRASSYELEPAPVLEPKLKKLSTPKIEKINEKDTEAIFVKPAEVEKAISVGEKPPKAVAEMQPSPKPEPKAEEVRSEVIGAVALGAETELVLPEVSAELEATAVLAPIEKATRGSSRIKINAINNSWIQIRDDNLNAMLVTRLLAAGDSYAVPDQPGLVLLTGNAGALEIVVDGITVPSIGGPGVVRRGVILEVDRLKAGAAVSN
jgi:cytoskeleton protein RodZ